MKKLFIIAILLVPMIALASPFITSGTQADAEKFRLRLSSDNGVTWGEWIEGDPVSGGAKFEASGIAKGIYKGELQAGATTELTDEQTGTITSVFTWSESSFFKLTRKSSNKPIIIKINQ